MKNPIVVEGRKCERLENLGFQASVSCFSMLVQDGDAQRVAVRKPGQSQWRFWTSEDRLRAGSGGA